MKKKVFIGLLLSSFLLISVVACREDNQSIATPTSIETSEAVEIAPTETPALQLEIIFPTPTTVSTSVLLTPVPTIIPPTITEKGLSSSPQSEPEFTGLTEEALEEAKTRIEKIEQEFPISQILPYGGPFYNEPFAIHNPSPDGTILIDIDSAADFEKAKEAAFDWIRSQGYDPEDPRYDFRFRVRSFP